MPSQQLQMGKLLRQSQNLLRTHKRVPKIPAETKKKFLKALQTQPCIKKTAEKFGINYSTAKTIIHANRKFFDEREQENDSEEYVPNKWALIKTFTHSKRNQQCCSYRQIETDSEKHSQSDTLKCESKPKHIQVISTTNWNFLKYGLPKC